MKELRKDETQRHIVDRDRPEELQVAMGAKLTGIKWPPQYKGRKAFAWHDGNFASVPFELVMLKAPLNSSLNKGIRSLVSAKAKWKFAPKHGKPNWLKFDKGDTITNIGCEYCRRSKCRDGTDFRIGHHPDDWCWCGFTSKGDWGFFPQAFIDPNTVQDDSPDNPSPD
jgi:hypothetical protein